MLFRLRDRSTSPLAVPAGMLLLAILAFLPSPTSAQSTPAASAAISGTVVDASTGAGISGAQVAVLAGTDSVAVAAAVTDAAGRFRVTSVAAGSYRVSVSRVGYTRALVPAIVRAAAVNLGTVRLSPSALTLAGVVVTAQPPAVVYGIDRDVYSVAALPGSAGSTATEVLGQVPELEVDPNGGITLRGQRPQVYINGRPAPMQGEALDAFLQSYAAENIENVEVMANPSARYQAEGAGGIVNIVLKKDARLGTNGSVFANAGTRGQSGIGGRATHQDGALTLNGGASLRLNRTDSETSELRQNLLADPVTYLRQDARSERLSWSGGLDLGAEYRLTRKSTLAAEARLDRNLGDSDRTTLFSELDETMEVMDEYDRTTRSESGGVSGEVSLQFEHEFATRDHELSIEVEHSRGRDSGESLIRRRLEEEFSGNLDYLFEVTADDTHESENETSIGIDYARPLGENAAIEIGYDGTFGEDSDERIRRIGLDGTPDDAFEVRETGFSNSRVLNSLYLTANRRFGKVSAQLGMRGEHSNATYDSESADPFEHDYLSLFPSANVSYSPAQGRRLRLSYSLRTRRPTANVVNPADRSNDPMNRQVGNPDIDPQLTHSLGLDASWSGDVGTVRLSPFYQRTTDEWAQLKTVDPDGVSTSTWGNLASTSAYGSALSLSLRDLYGVRGTVNLNARREHRDWSELVGRADLTTTRWSVRTNLSGNVSSTATLQGSLGYNPGRETAQGRTSGNWTTTLSMRQRFMDGKASLNLNLSDPLGLGRTSTTTRGTGFIELGSSRQSTRRATLSLTYNFGNGGRRAGGR